eukprot:COSAG01_NODE_2611_length_7384_cov_7.141386_5_plen_226_part_00
MSGRYRAQRWRSQLEQLRADMHEGRAQDSFNTIAGLGMRSLSNSDASARETRTSAAMPQPLVHTVPGGGAPATVAQRSPSPPHDVRVTRTQGSASQSFTIASPRRSLSGVSAASSAPSDFGIDVDAFVANSPKPIVGGLAAVPRLVLQTEPIQPHLSTDGSPPPTSSSSGESDEWQPDDEEGAGASEPTSATDIAPARRCLTVQDEVSLCHFFATFDDDEDGVVS